MRILLILLIFSGLSLTSCHHFWHQPPGHDPYGSGNSENAPGHDPHGPGNSENAPGHNK